MKSRLWHLILVATLCFAGMYPALSSAASLGGFTITNQAQANYVDSDSGASGTLQSNSVNAVVPAIEPFTLVSSQTLAVNPGGTLYFRHTLTNTSGGSDTFSIQLSALAGDFAFSGIDAYVDANNDGVPDNATPITSTGPLANNAAFHFVVAAQVPAGAQPGQQDALTVTANLSGGTPAQALSNTDTAAIPRIATLSATKSISVSAGLSPNDMNGAHILVTLVLRNNDTIALTNINITDIIGGVSSNPAYDSTGMDYVPGSAKWDGNALTDATGGDPAGISYLAILGVGNASISATLDSLAPGATTRISYLIDIKPGLPVGSATTTNASLVSYFDGAATQSVTSNLIAYTVTSYPDLTLVKTHTGNFAVGVNGEFRLTVSNIGSVATSRYISVMDYLPAGLEYVPEASGGTGWSCSADTPQIINCATFNTFPAHSTLPVLKIVVKPTAAAAAASPLTNIAIVSGGGEPTELNNNNVADDTVIIEQAAWVSGHTWLDANHDRLYDAGEQPQSGMLVELLDADGNLVLSTLTDAQGYYLLGPVVPGPGYQIRFRKSGGSMPVFATPVNGEQGVPISQAVIADGIIQSITLIAGKTITEQSLPLDPSGVVYDSWSRLPLAGAVVTLSGPPGFDPGVHLVGGALNASQTTTADGQYQFVLRGAFPAGVYTISVAPPPDYVSPSVLISAQPGILTPPPGPGVYLVQAQMTPPPKGSPTTYYLRLNLSSGVKEIGNNHIPLDQVVIPGTGLLVEKSSPVTSAEIGDYVDYTIVVKNTTVKDMADVVVGDTLPYGFVYQLGSTHIDGVAAPDPDGGQGPELSFHLGDIAPNSSKSVTYRVQIGVNTRPGVAVNRAHAISVTAGSNTGSAAISVSQGVFSDNGFIAGRMYMDCNRDRQQQQDEIGIPGVRLFMEDGTSVTTDMDGKFSLYGVTPNSHILKVDRTTLPVSMQLEQLSGRNAGVADSRFIDLKKGELLRADFASDSCSEGMLDEVRQRGNPDSASANEAERMLKYKLNPDANQSTLPDPRSLPSSGTVDGNPGQPASREESGFSSLTRDSELNALNSNLPPAPVAVQPVVELESLLDGLDNSLDFINLKDGDVLPMAQTMVRIKGTAASTFSLAVNGNVISDRQVGKKAVLQDRQLEAWEYFGIDLKPGGNELTVTMTDQFGNPRGSRTIHVTAPDKLAHIELSLPENLIADGKTPVKVVVRLLDQHDVPVTARTPLLLEASNGLWLADDLNTQEDGVQVFISGGYAEYQLLPPAQPGPGRIRVSSGIIEAKQDLAWLPELRPMVAAGVLEGVLNLRHLNAGSLVPVDISDSFDREIQRFSYGNDNATAAARGALFLKGKVKGDYLLTLAYDSDKENQGTLFRDIQPDKYYPVYGDASEKGYDAQSTSRLYVRVDKGRSYLLYGDYQTQSASQELSLSQYSRSLTGVKGHYETGKAEFSAFASESTSAQVIEEFPANGTSGPFQLNTRGATVNSEKVEILTRDRNQPSLILKAVELQRFVDYEIESVSGDILFSSPVPSLDVNLNPISIRVTYELDQGGASFWVGGGSGRYKLTDKLELGANIVKDNNPQQPSRMFGLNAAARVGDKTLLLGEVAQTRTATDGTGFAQRVELRHDGDRLQGRIYAGSSDTTFNNPSSVLSQGRQEAGGKGSYQLSDATRVTAEAVATKDRENNTAHEGILLQLEHELSDTAQVEVGTRDTLDTSVQPGQESLHIVTLRGKLSMRLESVPGATVSAEVEQDVRDSSRKTAALAGEYQLGNRGRLYARHEFLSSLSSAYALNGAQTTNTTVIGLDTDYTDHTHLFSEYRVRGAIDGPAAEAAVGMRNHWQLQPGLQLNLGLERVRSLSDSTTARNSKAYTAGLAYTASPDWKGATRLEYNSSDTTRAWLNSMDAAIRLRDGWSLLGKEVYSITTGSGTTTGSRILSRLLGGLAWRDMQHFRWDALGKYERRRRTDTMGGSDFWQVIDIVSLNLNYQPDHDWQLTGHYAGKLLDDHSLGLMSSSITQLLSGRIMHDFNEHWDGSLLASWMTTNGASGGNRYGLGAELGYMVQDNVWLSIGYNFFGFNDPDQIGLNYTSQGIYLRLRYKFDEDLMTRAFDDKDKPAQ